jgi:hypothetical protein
MDRKWMPITAGILDILNGAYGIFCLNFGSPLVWYPFAEVGGLVLIIIGVLAIAGSAYAFRRKRWGLALAGSILAIIIQALLMEMSLHTYIVSEPFFEVGVFSILFAGMVVMAAPAIFAVILTVLSRKQFEGQ